MQRGGFLIRGTLRPQMGAMTGMTRNPSASMSNKHVPRISPQNRIPGSIVVKRNSFK